jgi:hypothetical protein
MNSIPITIIDDFLENPKTLRDYALKLNYTPNPDSTWPGTRSDSIDVLNPGLFRYLSYKILSLFVPVRKGPEILNTGFKCQMNFQIIESEGSGWIHQDPNIFTSILYLNDEKDSTNCGTSLYSLKPNIVFPYLSQDDINLSLQRIDHYKTGKISKDLETQKNHFNKKTYDKLLDIPNKFNRLISFSSEMFHSANLYSNSFNTPRLTLICFWDFIHSDLLLPIPRSKRIPMI